MKLQQISSVIMGLALFVTSSAQAAEAFPTRPIRLIVTLSPGGPTDILARYIGQKLTPILGKPIIVDNRTGAGGHIGTEIVAKAQADGHTLLMGTSGTMAISVSLFPTLPYDPIRDFAPIVLAAKASHVMAVHPSVPARSVVDFIKLAEAKPNTLTYGSTGVGQANHLAVELFRLMTGVTLVHIPYKGAAPVMTDLITGQIHLTFASTPLSIPQMKAGKLRALGISSAKRLPQVPELPTIAESGVPGFESGVWYGVVAPSKTPSGVTDLLAKEILTILRSSEANDYLSANNFEIAAAPPKEFAAFIKSEIAKWGKVVKASGARID
jgi:tripartite-type tricarboxylate transporter receptor subunit TctC